MAGSNNEGWRGPGSRTGNGFRTPRCVSIALRLYKAIEKPITIEMARQLGVAILNPDAATDDPILVGFFAECTNCAGVACVDVDRIGRITDVSPIPGYPELPESCHTIAGCALMNSLREAANDKNQD